MAAGLLAIQTIPTSTSYLMFYASIFILLASFVGLLLGIRRIGRLVISELIKITSNPFLIVSVLMLIVFTWLGGSAQFALSSQKASEWAGLNSFRLFTYGVNVGTIVASVILVAYSSILFAGEFNRGTIKLLLTRPVTRTDIFMSKLIVAIFLSLFFYGVILYISALFGLSRGDLGAVWDEEQYLIQRSEARMWNYLWISILVSYLPLLAACLWGMFFSNIVNSAVLSVIGSLISYFLLLNGTLLLMDHNTQVHFFPFYLQAGFDILKAYAQGEGTLGFEPGHEAAWFKPGGVHSWFFNDQETFRIRIPLYLRIPVIYIGFLLAPAYAAFRWKNVHA